MNTLDSASLLQAMVILVPLLGGGILAWQRATLSLKESAQWRAKMDAHIETLQKNTDQLNEKLSKLDHAQQELRLRVELIATKAVA